MACTETGDNQETNKESGVGDGVENTQKVQADHNSIAIGGISVGGDLSGEVHVAGRDIIKNINTIYERALTTAEEAAQSRKLESELLARGVAGLAQSLSAQVSEGMQSDTPYKGLLAYSLNEAEIYYGRKEAKRDLLTCLRQGQLTVLHAESGAGKTSLLQAGIAAQLIAHGQLAIHLRSHDTNPVDFIKQMFLPELAQAPILWAASLREFLRQVCAVLGAEVYLYLFLDQFEEFFNLLKKVERRPFLEALANCLNDPSLKVRWVLALRAEALSDLSELEGFGIAPFKNMYRLNRLSRLEAQEAIVEPAGRYGITFEPALIEHIVDTLITNDEVMPTHLQLVCSALTDDLPEDKTLTLADYTEREGDTEGILRDYLRRQLEHLPREEQALAWKVLQTLITADRQRAVKTHEEIVNELETSGVRNKQIDTILKRLVERRLLFTPPAAVETFELAHDYLINEIELDPQEQAHKAAQELLDQETRTYQRHKTLLSPERLAVIKPYQNELHFSTDAKALFSESQKAVQQEQRLRERRRNITVGISLAVAILMSLLAIWGFRSSAEATKQAEEAKKQANIALALQLAAQSQNLTLDSSSYVLGGLLAVEAGKRLNEFEVQESLRQYLSVSSTEVGRITFDNWVSSVSFSSDGKAIVAGGADGTVKVWQAATGPKWEGLNSDGGVSSVAFSWDDKYIVSGGADGTVKVWDATTGQEIRRVIQDRSVSSVALSPDGKYIVSGNDLGARVWELATGNEIAYMDHNGWVSSVAFSSGGEYVVSGGADGMVRVWDATTGQEIQHLEHDGPVFSVAISPDDEYIASGSSEGTVRVWETTTGRNIAVMDTYGIVYSVAFNPDGTRIVSGSEAGNAQIWDLGISAGEDPEIIRMKHGLPVYAVAFSPEGDSVVSGGADGIARLWDAETGKQVAGLLNNGIVFSLAFSSDGKHIVSGGCDEIINANICLHGTARVWEANTGPEMARMTLDKLMEEACKRLSRNLTKDEWAQYFPNEEYRKTCEQWPLEPETGITSGPTP